MAWLAICDHEERRLSLRGLGTDKQELPLLQDTPEIQLRRGTILFETRVSADAGLQKLFGYQITFPERRSLMFQALPGGGLAMVQVQGDAISNTVVQHSETGRTDVLRVTYTWDCDADWAEMTVEKPEEATIQSVDIENPQPLTVEDIRNLMLGRGNTAFSTDMIFAALSDQIEPVGPMPALLPSTPLETPWGFQAARNLKRGDTVVTRGDGIVPVLQTVMRVVPARGSFRPIRLRAPYFGLRQDIIVGPDQRVLIDGPEVEYLFGQEAVLVAARHLVNGFAALHEPCGPTICYAQILLPQHQTLMAAGIPIESLYISRLRRNRPQLQRTLLKDADRALLPEHPKPLFPVLRWYDAIHLARRRAA